jgi:hypothetical protein
MGWCFGHVLLVSSLIIPTVAHTESVRISGSVTDGAGYSVYLLSRDGSSKTASIGSNNRFKISGVTKTRLKNASLQLIDPEGRYFGPIVLQNKKNKVSTTFSGKLLKSQKMIALGRISLKDSYGALTARNSANLSALVARSTVTAVDGKPVGAGEFGLVLSTVTSSGVRVNAVDQQGFGEDPDLDGIPNAFDADADGDLILNSTDPDSRGGEVPYTSLFLDFRSTLNSNVRSGLTDSAIDAVIGGENKFGIAAFISLPEDVAANITGGYVICDNSLLYCRPNTPVGYFSGISESSPDFRGKPWVDLLTSDGFPRMEIIELTGGKAVVASFQPRVGRAQFRPGDVLRTVLTSDTRELGSKTFTVEPYFVSVPAIQSYNAGLGAVSLDYSAVGESSGSIPGVSPSDPIILSSAGQLSLTFWRPQRQALRSDETGFYDWGNNSYGVVIGEAQATCAGLYSNVSPELIEDTSPLGDESSVFFNRGANGYPYRDSLGDRAASVSNTLSMTVDLKTCLSRTGRSPGAYYVTLSAAGELVTGGQSIAAQGFYVQIP